MGRSFFGVAIALFLLGAIAKEPVVSYLGAILLVTSSIFWVYSKLALDDLVYSKTLEQSRAFFGDTLELKVEVRNEKPLPVWLNCQDEVPWVLDFPKDSLEPLYKYERAVLKNRVFLHGYEKVTRRFPIRCQKRGVFQFGPATLSSADPMGLYKVTREDVTCNFLTVYPRYVPLEEDFSKLLNPFGDYHRQSWMYEDPSLFKGSRPYAPGDPMKLIHWKQVASKGTLQTRTYESSFNPKIVLCLNLSTSSYVWEGVNEEMFESLITAAASLAAALAEKGFSLGLCSNGLSRWMSPKSFDSGVETAARTMYNSSFPVSIPPSSEGAAKKESRLLEILSCLAGVTYLTFGGFRSVCQKPWVMAKDTLPIILTGTLSKEVLGLLSDLSGARGRKDKARKAILMLLNIEPRDSKASFSTEKELKYLERARLFSGKVLSARLSGGWLSSEKLEIEEMQ